MQNDLCHFTYIAEFNIKDGIPYDIKTRRKKISQDIKERMSNKRASPQSVLIKYQVSEYIRDGEERNSHESFNILCLTHP